MLLKLDMGKVYDRVEWDYLEQSLNILGFPPWLTKLMMLCVTTASFSILIKAVPKGPIKPSRRLC